MYNNLSFLDAAKIIKDTESNQSKTVNLISSFNIAQLEIYLKAYAKIESIDLKLETIPFGTLNQYVLDGNNNHNNRAILLTPSDFSPALDWRTGFPEKPSSTEDIMNEVMAFKLLIEKNNFDSIFFLPIDIPPLFEKIQNQFKIELCVKNAANDLNAVILNDTFFSLDSYLSSGCPIGGAHLSTVAHHISDRLFKKKEDTKKIIVTDLDNTLWSGILGEDGLDGINASSEGKGFHHFIYQTYLKKLKDCGTLLSVCSKNDEDLVSDAFKKNDFVLTYEDFVSIQASYNPKSLQIKELSKTLNLGLDSFVFIDDNPVEINEVQSSLPDVACILFNPSSVKYVDMYKQLSQMFSYSNPTDEDRNRTNLYKSMKKSVNVIEGQGSDLSSFLKSLKMKLIFTKKTNKNNIDRAIQLINKTNQFNLNGIRMTSEEVNAIMTSGGSLFTASLSDVNGEHGEILSFLIDKNNDVRSFVLSCRVFQRKVEYLFLSILFEKYFDKIKLSYEETERNSPFKIFINSITSIDPDKDIFIVKDQIDKAEPNLFKIFSKEKISIKE